jgi:pimeloyl-ACP methyl ester carboxylesterase
MKKYSRLLLLAVTATIATTSCFSTDEAEQGSAPVGDEAIEVVSEAFFIPGAEAPPNPLDGRETPGEQNGMQAIVYRAAGEGANTTPVEAELKVLLVPGFTGGANMFHYMATRLVERTRGGVEVWTIDRRSNHIEDMTGLEAAEQASDPEVAWRYYFEGESINGAKFAGVPTSEELSHLSEWGVKVFMDDLMAVVMRAEPDLEKRKKNLFIAGHSLGGALVACFAGWDFDGDPETTDDAGYNQVAGLVLLDGGPVYTGAVPTKEQYLNGFETFYATPGLNALRNGEASPTVSFPLLTPTLLITLEIIGMYAAWLPDQLQNLFERSDEVRFMLMTMFGGVNSLIATNRALLGIALDDDFQPLTAERAAMGKLTGGLVETWTCPAVICGRETELLKPGDPLAEYDWLDFEQAGDDSEVTDIDDLARGLFQGESNLTEAYFPARLTLDIVALVDLDTSADGDWRSDDGLSLYHTRKIDVPVIAFGAGDGVLPDAAGLNAWEEMIDRVDGIPGNDGYSGFDVIICDDYNHVDVLYAEDRKTDNCVFSDLLAWIDAIANQPALVTR